MILGFVLTPTTMLAGGLTLILLLVIQTLLGMRKFNLGRKTFTYHKYLAWAILAVAAFHALFGIVFAYGLRLF